MTSLDQLYRHVQVAQMNERHARSASDRKSYRELVNYYERRIRERGERAGTGSCRQVTEKISAKSE